MKIVATFTGIRPLIMHNGRLADPIDPYSVALKKLSSQKKKTEVTHQQMASAEWDGGIYWSEDLGVYVPTDNIEAMFVAGAKKLRLGKDALAAMICDAEYGVTVKYEGPKSLDKMKEDPRFCMRKGVRVQQNRIMRTRPMIPTGWQITVPVEFDDTVLNRSQVEDILEQCGLYIGLGDWRPKFGRFTVEVLK
jgi:hypothetical protein